MRVSEQICICRQIRQSFLVRRPKKMTEKFGILQDLCEAFDNFTESERKLNLFKYLGLFSRRDAIPDQYYEDSDDLETEPQTVPQ